jgi:small-conductance mechanosensitive channel
VTLTLTIVDRAADTLGGFLPRLGGALVLLVIGIVVARILGKLLARGLRGAGLDALAERVGAADVLERARLGRSVSALVGRALRIGLTIVVLFAALSLLGLQFLSESLNSAVLFLPNVAVAGLLLLVGLVLGALVRERVDRLTREMDLPVPAGVWAQVAVVAVFAITAASQIAISTAILMALIGILLAGAVATVALSFGLGGSGVAREVTAGRYVRGNYEPGQEIGFGDVRGTVVAVEAASTVLRGEGGETIRVPNQLLLSSVVTVYRSEFVTPEETSES